MAFIHLDKHDIYTELRRKHTFQWWWDGVTEFIHPRSYKACCQCLWKIVWSLNINIIIAPQLPKNTVILKLIIAFHLIMMECKFSVTEYIRSRCHLKLLKFLDFDCQNNLCVLSTSAHYLQCSLYTWVLTVLPLSWLVNLYTFTLGIPAHFNRVVENDLGVSNNLIGTLSWRNCY